MTSIVKFDRRHDTIAKIEQWQLKQSIVQDQDDHVTVLPSQGHVSRLCQFLLDLFREIMVLLRKENKTSSAIEMDLERSRSAIVLWSDGYGIAQGDFDETLEKSNRLRRAVVKTLSHIGAILIERLIPQAEIGSDQLQGLCLRVRTALEDAGRLIGDGVGSDSDSDSDESSSGDSVRSSGDDMAEIAEDLRTDTCCLAGLGPLLKNPVYDMPAEAEPQTLLACTWHPTQHYSDKIQSRFPQADKDLVNRLGKANYKRYLRCQAVRDDGHQNEGSVAGEDTASYMAPTLAAGSKFHDSGIGSSIAPTTVSYAETVMSYSHDGRSVRVPPLPEGAKDGRPFECVACSRMVVMKNASAWKRHIYLDLQPYACLDLQCAYNGAPFPSRRQWVSHLALDHDMDPDWRSINCSLCLQETGEGKRSIVQHLSRHLEEISLSALPAGIDSNTTSEVDSENDGPEDILPARNAADEDPKQQIKTQDSDSSQHDQPGDRNRVPQAAALGKEQLQHMPVMPTICRDCKFYAREGPDQQNKLLQHYNSEEHRINRLQRYRFRICTTRTNRFL
ncbi:hypothetical protein QBC42DRAFT_45550 [Cladorrhinum samala]|uniref:Oxidoreductase acuF-like C2H2 type zinc-finger domain-containing protein n=1 Tax=Cladorrhinum samala TaxID=585594 RepID=A0AAV9HZ68_9PEZI|nr:hypothetical protein QBC42DRAFT_45550 [Cladorrhinum samala]